MYGEDCQVIVYMLPAVITSPPLGAVTVSQSPEGVLVGVGAGVFVGTNVGVLEAAGMFVGVKVGANVGVLRTVDVSGGAEEVLVGVGAGVFVESVSACTS